MDWPSFAGAMRYRPEQLTIDTEQLQMAIEQCYKSIYALDMVIEKYAYALELIQPSVPGKMAIRMLKRPWGGQPGRHPQIIQWYRSRNGRWLYNILPHNKVIRGVKAYPVMAPVREDVQAILYEARDMIAHREKILATVNNFKRQINAIRVTNDQYLKSKEQQVDVWMPLLLEKRNELIAAHKESVMRADAALPQEIAPNPRKRPRVNVMGRTLSRTAAIRATPSKPGKR